MGRSTTDNGKTKLARMRRTPTLVGVLACLLALLATSTPAEAVTRKQLREARERYERLQGELNRLAEEYAKQEERAENLEIRIGQTNKSLRRTSQQGEQLREQLQSRVRTAYRMGGIGFFDFLLSSDSFRDFSLRAVLLERQASHDEDLMLKLRRVTAEQKAKRAQLKRQEKSQREVLSGLKNKAVELDRAFGAAKGVLAKLEDEKKAEELAAALRTRRFAASGGGGDGGSGRVVGMARCPAAGPHAFSNDWGAPRGGGRRRHKGNDIFAPMGSPAVAVVSGTISRHGSGGNAGLSIYLWGDNGVEYFYAHMSGFAGPAGARVSAGEVIGYVGNTGNARGGAPHIHFEVHPGGGAPINPYYSLIKVC